MVETVTLTVDSELLNAARARALKEQQTLDSAFGKWLERYAQMGERAAQYHSIMEPLKHVSAGRGFSRAKTNER